jgi:hypothetical protein
VPQKALEKLFEAFPSSQIQLHFFHRFIARSVFFYLGLWKIFRLFKNVSNVLKP